ncbi:MAG: calcium-binding protein [Solirubrobacterales bacterium]|nr:calcium-binding protein [Solirubrobacterales bacterium]
MLVTRMRPALAAVSLAATLAAVAAGPAPASTVEVQTGAAGAQQPLFWADVHYDAAAGERNAVTVGASLDPLDGSANPVTIEENGATIASSGGAVQLPFPSTWGPSWVCNAAAHTAVCASSTNAVGYASCTASPGLCGYGSYVDGFRGIFVNLGDGNDRVTLSMPPTTSAGVTVSMGAGDDVVQARDGVAEYIDCGDGVDWVRVDANDVPTGCETVVAS